MAKSMKNSELRNIFLGEVAKNCKNKTLKAGGLALATVALQFILNVAKQQPNEEDELYREQE